jgi:hypothetical protein
MIYNDFNTIDFILQMLSTVFSSYNFRRNSQTLSEPRTRGNKNRGSANMNNPKHSPKHSVSTMYASYNIS